MNTNLCKRCKHYNGTKRLKRPNFHGEPRNGITFDYVIDCAKLGYFDNYSVRNCEGFEYREGGMDADIIKNTTVLTGL